MLKNRGGGCRHEKLIAFTAGVLLHFNTSYAYDTELAQRFNGMFSQMTPEVIKQRSCEVSAKQLFEMIKKGEPFVFLDIRTPDEMSITDISCKDTIRIPMHELFKEENLKKLPKDKKSSLFAIPKPELSPQL